METEMDTLYEQSAVSQSDVIGLDDEDDYDAIMAAMDGDDSDSEATVCAIEDLDDELGDEGYEGLTAEDLFQLIMSDHQYLQRTLGGGDGHHVGQESPIPNAADIQNFFLKAMNLAAFEPFKDDELKMKCSACSSQCGLTLPLDKLTKKFTNKQNCNKNHGSGSSSERSSNKSRRSHVSRSKETAEKCVSSAKTSISSAKTTVSSAKSSISSANTPVSSARSSVSPAKTSVSSAKPPVPSALASSAEKTVLPIKTSISSGQAPVSSAKPVAEIAAMKEGGDMTIQPSRWTSECKAVFEKLQQTSYLGCALTLLQKMWADYINRPYETIRQEEIERAKTVDFCSEVQQMIEDKDRYVCQIIEEMEPTAFTTSFVI